MSRFVSLVSRYRSGYLRCCTNYSLLRHIQEKRDLSSHVTNKLRFSTLTRTYFTTHRPQKSESNEITEKTQEEQKKPKTRVLSPEIGATGLEREEMELNKQGRPYILDDILTGPFGTPENPVLVPSAFDSRIVGCMGGPGPLSHNILWHLVKKDKPLVCLECGQVFKLVPLEQWEEMQLAKRQTAEVTHHHTDNTSPSTHTTHDTKTEQQQHHHHHHHHQETASHKH